MATDTIEGSGFPLGFPLDATEAAPVFAGGKGKASVVVEARMMAGHQKEAVVHEGVGGPRWRLVSDEGLHLGGTDLAPFPLGFFNAGLHGDLMARIASIADSRGEAPDGLELSIRNFYWMTGSFIKGTGEGFSDPSEVELSRRTDFLAEAAAASPAMDALRRPLSNTFALYVNGCREQVSGVSPSKAPDAPDPYRTYSSPPAPMESQASDADNEVIRKTGAVEEGEVRPAPAGTDTRIIRTVSGRSRMVDGESVETDTWLEMPGVSHFALRSGWAREGRRVPSGLALLSAGVSFCYLTQLSRYIHHLKLDIGGARLVQYWPFSAEAEGRAGPVDTHLFLNGRADAETHGNLLRIAARTCYLHATLSAALPPVLKQEN